MQRQRLNQTTAPGPVKSQRFVRETIGSLHHREPFDKPKAVHNGIEIEDWVTLTPPKPLNQAGFICILFQVTRSQPKIGILKSQSRRKDMNHQDRRLNSPMGDERDDKMAQCILRDSE